MIKVSNLDKYYNKGKENEIHVINNTSIVLPNSGLVAFLGQSGSGKTTLINTIAGLDKAKGDITYDEAIFHNYKMGKIDKFRVSNIGYVFQNYNLLGYLTVYENLKLQLSLIGVTDINIINERINYVLDSLKIKKLKNKLASNLSGGQMQRVSIARCLVKDSKIIICDEPTGNLDSENTIQVMNILKSISKTKLVILVTHDRKNASFYADRIVEIKDGVIDKDYENDVIENLDTRNSNMIYLKDMKNVSFNLDNVNLNLYSDDIDIEDLNITIVKNNGIIYLKCDNANYLTNDSKVKLIDDNYHKLTKTDIEKFEFNPTRLDYKKKFSLRPLLNSIKESYVAFKSSTKKMKWLNFCSILIGIVMAITIVILSVSTRVNDDKLQYSNNAYTVSPINGEDDEIKDKMLDEIASSKLIYDIYSTVLYEPSIVSPTSSYSQGEMAYKLNANLLDEKDLIYGRNVIADDEVVVTTKVADNIIKQTKDIWNDSYKTLIGRKISSVSDGDKTIVGISNSDALNIYYNYYNATAFVDKAILYAYANDFVGYYKNGNYELCAGSDLTESSNDECLVYISLYLENKDKYSIGSKVELCDREFTIVGYYKGNNGAEFIVSDIDTVKKSIKLNDIFEGLPLLADDVTLVEGRMPENRKEALINRFIDIDDYPEYKEWIKDYTIVGTFDCVPGETRLAVTKEEMICKDLDSMSILIIEDKDVEKVEELCAKYDYALLNIYDSQIASKKLEKKRNSTTAFSIMGALLAIVVVYSFFVMRSKMLHRIYEIGVLREIGAKRIRIYRSFFAEILVTTTLTSVIGYGVTLILCNYGLRKVGDLLSLATVSPFYALCGFLALYSVSIIAGLFPVFLLLRKTPAEIVSKYDL